MVFAGIPFLFYFLPLLLAAYYAVPPNRRRARNGVLLGASLLFYAWGEGLHVLVLVGSILGNHFVAKRISTNKGPWLTIGIVGNLAALGVFKYAGFFGQTVGLGAAFDLHLPLGISFFTFQAISFLIDVKRGDASPPGRLDETGLYIASFPQLIAGPIVRFKTIAAAIRERGESVALFAEGVRLFLLGLGQKVLLANLAAGPADQIFALPPDQLTTALAWAGAATYSLQIFFDFAGYSNMAMGLGLMLGFRFPRNFDFPYLAGSFTAFWRRWHMTLSAWFRDYLYIPLGGNRGGLGRTILNLWIVFLLCGLWHGAAWTFVLWGAFHGLFLTLERLGLGAVLARLPRPIGHSYLLVFVLFSWVLFRAEDIDQAGRFYAAMLAMGAEGASLPLRAAFPGATAAWLCVAAIFATPLPGRAMGAALGKSAPVIRGGIETMGFALLFVAVAAFLAGGVYNPFIYFRF